MLLSSRIAKNKSLGCCVQQRSERGLIGLADAVDRFSRSLKSSLWPLTFVNKSIVHRVCCSAPPCHPMKCHRGWTTTAIVRGCLVKRKGRPVRFQHSRQCCEPHFTESLFRGGNRALRPFQRVLLRQFQILDAPAKGRATCLKPCAKQVEGIPL